MVNRTLNYHIPGYQWRTAIEDLTDSKRRNECFKNSRQAHSSRGSEATNPPAAGWRRTDRTHSSAAAVISFSTRDLYAVVDMC